MDERSCLARPRERVPYASAHNRWRESHPCRDHCEHTAKPPEVKPYGNYTVEGAGEARGNQRLEQKHRYGKPLARDEELRAYVPVRRIPRAAIGLRFSFAGPGLRS